MLNKLTIYLDKLTKKIKRLNLIKNIVVFLGKTKIIKRFLFTIYTWNRILVKLHQRIKQNKVNKNYLKNMEKYQKIISEKIYLKILALLNRKNANIWIRRIW